MAVNLKNNESVTNCFETRRLRSKCSLLE